MQDRTFIEIQTGIPEHRNSKYYRLNSVENNHGSWLLVGILQLAGNQLLGILKITVVVQYNTVGIWLPVPVVIYFQSLVSIRMQGNDVKPNQSVPSPARTTYGDTVLQ